jgi:hypothetical protein
VRISVQHSARGRWPLSVVQTQRLAVTRCSPSSPESVAAKSRKGRSAEEAAVCAITEETITALVDGPPGHPGGR